MSFSPENDTVTVHLDQPVSYARSNVSGFYVCCLESADRCDSDSERSLWSPVPRVHVSFDSDSAFELRLSGACKARLPDGVVVGTRVTGVAYAWETNPG